ncbi:fibronectin type III domain-containing protein [Candidatus Hydrogenedentota bacterium]
MSNKAILLFSLVILVTAFNVSAEDLSGNYLFRPYLSNPKPDGITIAWVSDDVERKARVIYGKEDSCKRDIAEVNEVIQSDHYPKRATGKKWKEDPLYKAKTFVHKVRIRGLEQGQKYSYGVEGAGLPPHQGHFNTIPTSENAEVLFTFGGDLDSAMPDVPDVEFVEKITGKKMDFFLDLGDWAVVGGRFGMDWQSDIPVVVVRGNHDSHNTTRYTSSSKDSTTVGHLQHYYDFDDNNLDFTLDWGPVCIVISGSHMGVPLTTKKADWVASKFAASTKPLKLYATHGVFFSDDMKHGKEGPARRQQMWPILTEHDVPLAYSGHAHQCQRTHRVNTKGEPDPKGTYNIVLGGTEQKMTKTPSPWSAFRYYNMDPKIEKIIGFTHVKNGVAKTALYSRKKEEYVLLDSFEVVYDGKIPPRLTTKTDIP